MNISLTRTFLPLFLFALSSVVLVGLNEKPLGWIILFITAASTLLINKIDFRKHFLVLIASLGILGLVPISTEVTDRNFIRMGLALTVAVALPYLITKHWFKSGLVKFSLGGKWSKNQIGFLILAVVIAYLLIPLYLSSSGAYENWTVINQPEQIFRLFIGTNALGIWDELFFVICVLGILRKFIPFFWANFFQAIAFTSFLYELGFRGWGPLMIYPFALLQGYIFKRTESLLYVIALHLSYDFILFLALINAHHPELADIFIT